MLVERAELTAKPGAEDDFSAVMTKRGCLLLRSIDGVISVRFGRGVENPSKFMLLVEWRSLDAHAAYNATPQSIELRTLMGPHLAGGAMEHFEMG